MLNMQYLRSSVRKKIISVAVAGIGVSIPGGIIIFHGPLIHKYKGLLQMYKTGAEVPVSKRVQALADQVLQECKLTVEEKQRILFFTTFGLNVVHLGMTLFPSGAFVGLPFSFNYKKMSDIDTSSFQFPKNKLVDLDSDDGELLLNSFILSEKAQKFAVAREIYHCTTNYVILYGLLGSLAVLGSYRFIMLCTKHYNLHKLSKKLRFMIFISTGLAFTTLSLTLKDLATLNWDRCADSEASNISGDYLEGGIEFYEKTLQRNKALRSLLESDGKSLYTSNGNPKIWIRTKTLPISARLDFLKEKLQKRNLPKD